MSRYSYGVIALVLLMLGALVLSHNVSPSSISESNTSLASADFGGVPIHIEFATTTAARELGLGNRTNVPSMYGMLFVFPKDDFYGFWMKDTLVPLDMFWLDATGKVVSSAQDVLPASYPEVFYPSAPARYVLETAAGFAQEYDIATGTPLLLTTFPTASE